MSKRTSKKRTKITLRKDKTLTQLLKVDKKRQKGAFVTAADENFYDYWVNTDYASAPVAQFFLDVDGEEMPFQSTLQPDQLQMKVFRHTQKKVPYSVESRKPMRDSRTATYPVLQAWDECVAPLGAVYLVFWLAIYFLIVSLEASPAVPQK